MPQYALDSRQQTMLRALLPLLESREIGPSWILIHGGDALQGIITQPNNGQFPPEWENADDADIHAFIDCGLMKATKHERWGDPSNVTVFTHKIRQAIEANFDDPRVQPQSVSKTINIQGDVTGSQIGIDAKFENIRVTIEKSPSIPDDKKKMLEEVTRDLLGEVDKLASSEDKETIVECTQSVVDEIGKEKPNKHTIAGNKNALQSAAQNLQIIAPTVFSLAGQFILLLEHIKYHP